MAGNSPVYKLYLKNKKMEVKSVNSTQNQDSISTDTLSTSKCKLYLSEGVGWIGSVLVLIPYVIPLDKTIDFVLNALGASGLFIVCLTSRQYQSVIINAAWVIGSFYKYFS
jgi:hypothetical protein